MNDFGETIKDGQNVFSYEDDPCYTINEYFDRDIELLIILLLFEAYENGLSSISMGNLVKMNYWHTDEITSEVYEYYDDHWGIETLLLDTLIFILDDLRLGRADSIALTHFSKAMDRIAENAVRAGNEVNSAASDADIREISMKYSAMINSLLLLNPTYLQLRKEAFEASNVESLRDRMEEAERIVENISDFEKSPLTDLVMDVPELIEVDFTINSKRINTIRHETERLLSDFSKDIPTTKPSPYAEPSINFNKQIDNFCEYLNTLTLVEGVINIPFSVLFNHNFEAVKVMGFLKQKGTLIFNWNQSSHWRTKLLNVPITVDSLLNNSPTSQQPDSSIIQKTKYNLSFSKQPCALTFIDNDGLEKKIPIQGQVQKEVLRVIFKNMEQAFEEWSLHDISEVLGEQDVNVRAVKNAIYQFNKKVQSRIPDVKRLFDYNNDSAKLDPKYVSQS